MKSVAVTGEQVRAAVLEAGVTHIPHHACAFCGEWVGCLVHGKDLYFDPSCGCASSPPEPRAWSDAADWINMQTSEEARKELMARFGMVGGGRHG